MGEKIKIRHTAVGVGDAGQIEMKILIPAFPVYGNKRWHSIGLG